MRADVGRADDYSPPAATEQERLTKARFEAHFAFLLNPPMVKRATVDVGLFR